MPTVAAITVVVFAVGVVLFVTGWRGTTGPKKVRVDREPLDRELVIRFGVSVGVGVVAGVLSGWIGLVVAVMAVVYAMTGLYSDRARRLRNRDRLRAVAGWLEMMRDTIAAGAGLSSAVKMTARRAPEAIGPEARRLAGRLESMPFSEAIARFGAEVNVPGADPGLAALSLASRSAGGNLPELLSMVVISIRSRVEQRSRIEAVRARFLTGASLMVGITAVTSAMVLFGSAQMRRPYNSVIGQMVLLLVGGFFVLATWVLRRMGREAPAVRLIVESAT